MSQGRLAAAGDFRELRALMDDRPMRVRVRTDRPRELAGALLEAGNAVGVRLDGDQVLELDTTDARALSHALAPVARDRDAQPVRGAPARRRSRRRLPLPGAAMSAAESTAAAPSRPETLVSFLALYRLLLRTQITVPRLLGIAALGALSLLLGRVRPPGRQLGPGGRRRGLLLRARNPRPVRDALARHLGDRRPRRRPPARLPLAEARGALAASRRGGARDVHRRRAADRGAARRVRPHRGRRRRRPGGVPRRVVRGRSRTPACSSRRGSWFRRAVWWGLAFVLLWENVVAGTGRRRGPLHRERLGGVDSRPRARRRGVRHRPGPLPPRSSSSPRSRSSAGWSRRGATAAPTSTEPRVAQATRPSSTQPLWPPRPIAFESATSSSTPVCFRSRASFGT